MSILSGVKKAVLEAVNAEADRKIKELESRIETLLLDHEMQNSTMELRILNLKAALKQMLDMMRTEWSGADQQAVMRTCRAIMEDESWRK